MRYSMWYDDLREHWEIIRWRNGVPTVVQTNIRTVEKAERALQDWRLRAGAISS